jgi:hypothetical protein
MGSLFATPYGTGTPGIQPFAQQAYLQPFFGQSIGHYGIPGGQFQPQGVQLLQIVAQQLQQVQLLQQHQLAQLQQIQQLIQTLPQQVHQLQQQWQPLGANPLGFGLAPQTFAGQAAGHVM